MKRRTITDTTEHKRSTEAHEASNYHWCYRTQTVHGSSWSVELSLIPQNTNGPRKLMKRRTITDATEHKRSTEAHSLQATHNPVIQYGTRKFIVFSITARQINPSHKFSSRHLGFDLILSPIYAYVSTVLFLSGFPKRNCGWIAELSYSCYMPCPSSFLIGRPNNASFLLYYFLRLSVISFLLHVCPIFLRASCIQCHT